MVAKDRGLTANGYRGFVSGENVLKLIVAMAAQLCECTENH